MPCNKPSNNTKLSAQSHLGVGVEVGTGVGDCVGLHKKSDLSANTRIARNCHFAHLRVQPTALNELHTGYAAASAVPQVL